MYYAQEIYYLKALIFPEKGGGGTDPVNDRRVGGKHNTVKQADSGLAGVDAQEIPGGTPEANHVLAFCQASFRMTLARVGFLTLAPGTPCHTLTKWLGVAFLWFTFLIGIFIPF